MTRLGRWIGEHLILGIGLLVLLYMFVPIIIVVAMSFNEPASRNSYSFNQFTMNNWLNPCEPIGMCDSVVLSIQIGLLATLFATALGTLMAFALVRHRFRGLTVRHGLLLHGPAGWAEWSPFAEYARPEIDAWAQAAVEAAVTGYPEPVRDRVPVNVTVPATDPVTAHRIVTESGCTTAKVKVAERGQYLAEDVARLEAVRDALGPAGRLRIDANGAWSVPDALSRLQLLARFDLEYVEQPCASVEDLARLRRELARRGVSVPIAADESIRRSGEGWRRSGKTAASEATGA